jgi:ParB-like chromosome segregation protein Spo0J
VHCAHDALVPIGDLVEHPRNPKRHPPDQVALLAKIIKATGWRRSITVSILSKRITAGHGRLLAAKRAGLTVAPVDYQDYADEEEELRDVLADNRLAELAETDERILKEDLKLLSEMNVDLELAGFDQESFDKLLENVAVTEDDFLGEGFELPDGKIKDKDVMDKITIFVVRDVKKKVARVLNELIVQYGKDQIRIVR